MMFLNDIKIFLLILAGTISVLFLCLLISINREDKCNEKRKEKNMKKDNIWVQLSSGLNCVKKAYYYEIVTGVLSYRAVSLGRERISWLGIVKELILYRDENDKCHIEWVRKNDLLFRFLDYERKHGTDNKKEIKKK